MRKNGSWKTTQCIAATIAQKYNYLWHFTVHTMPSIQSALQHTHRKRKTKEGNRHYRAEINQSDDK